MQEIQKTRQEYIQALADVQGKVYQMGLRAEAAVQTELYHVHVSDLIKELGVALLGVAVIDTVHILCQQEGVGTYLYRPRYTR